MKGNVSKSQNAKFIMPIRHIVDELPEKPANRYDTYIVPTQGENTYTEYAWNGKSFIPISTFTLDLSTKVDKEDGKGLSSLSDYGILTGTANVYGISVPVKIIAFADQSGVESSAEVFDSDAVKTFFITKRDVQSLLNYKVDVIKGKGLSTNDYTDEEKAKLADLPNSAQYSSTINALETEIGGKVDKEDGKGLSDAASVSVYHANAGNEVLQLVGQDGVTKLTAFYGMQAVDDQMSAFSLGLSTKVDKDATGMRGLSNAKDVRLLDSASEASELEVTDQSGSSTSSKYYNSFVMDKMLAKLKEQSVPHTEVSDYPVTLTDALAGESLRGLKVYGGCGKNLYNEKNLPVSGYYYDANGAASAANSSFIRIPPIKCKGNTTYMVSSNLQIYTIWQFSNGAGVVVYTPTNTGEATPITITTQASTDELRISLRNTSGSADTTAFEWLQLEEGSTATAWEKYKEVGDADGDAYKIQVRLRGQNLFDKSKSELYAIRNETAVQAWGMPAFNNAAVKKMLKPGVTYTVTYTAEFVNLPDDEYAYSSAYNWIGFSLYDNVSMKTVGFFDKITQKPVNGDILRITKTFTTPESLDSGTNNWEIMAYTAIYLNGNDRSYGMVNFRDIQIAEGTTAPDYEPYFEQTQTATLTSPLTSGEYIDFLSKKRYASDGTATDITVEGELKTIESGRLTIDCVTEVQPPRIEAEYWQDINKVVGNLTSAILANGGNA